MTKTGEFRTNSADSTFELAADIGASISETTIFLLTGDLGVGKTVFAKGLAYGVGVDPDEVTSPTYTLVNQYEGRLRFYHLDLYRLTGSDEVRELGIEEILAGENSLIVIEWPDRMDCQQHPETYRVKIVDEGGESRRISIVKST
ncbi:MAG: tRNA (adenosine(37)-N6)-threonylcarbamoyltransferase complex ATPase subunit type 1 TsaE [Acidobacteria bacterium]|nr:tRNA (adenosine(37)-N6)-threonylcarbamoyltransferase complex ATPase subunit type 1 TsaE [Acidobacteriota bacterium]